MNQVVYQGHCDCKNIQVFITLPAGENLSAPRECDCEFCQKYQAAYVSNPNGTVIIRIEKKEQTDYLTQGTNTAFFIVCRHCQQLVSANYEENGMTYSGINASLLEKLDALNTETASPRLLDKMEKVDRWRKIWLKSKIEVITS